MSSQDENRTDMSREEEQFVDPIPNEIAAVRRLAGTVPEGLFPRRQRTDNVPPAFGDDDQNREKMDRPEPEVSHPLPASYAAHQDEGEATHNERHIGEVQHDDEVRSNSIERLHARLRLALV